MPPLKDLTGQKFGRLTVIEQAGRSKGGQALWHCRCECGREVVVQGGDLRSARTQSCGCFNRECSRKRFAIDGLRAGRLYRIWCGMRARCNNPNNAAYKNYGGRGIQVCEAWEHDYPAFRAWALANGYRGGCSIDRIDNEGNYEPSNCRWVNRLVQNRNTRKNHYLTHNGETLTVSEWAERTGIAETTIRFRLSAGWSVERALTEPVKKQTHKEEPK